MKRWNPVPWLREMQEGMDPNVDVRAGMAADEFEHLRATLDATHKLISEAALTGFNPHEGTWADRLFKNQAQIHAALNQR